MIRATRVSKAVGERSVATLGEADANVADANVADANLSEWGASGTRASDGCELVRLDFEGRHRRRVLLRCESGLEFLLDLAEVPSLQQHDLLQLEDGRCVRVLCADEALLEVRAGTPRVLARLAWHLGNRHLPTEIADGVIRLREDHVIEDMLQRLGAQVRHVRAPFHPEGGAYGHGRTHGHAHHDHDDGHAHGHDHAHDHAVGQSHDHDHDHDRDHDPGLEHHTHERSHGH